MERRECSVDGCGSSVLAKGLCGKHYQRMRDHGTTELLPKTADSMCCECGQRWAVYSSGKCRPCYQKERRGAQPFVGACLFCGAQFTSARRYAPETRRGMYCSRACKEAAYKADGRAAEVVLKSYYKTRYGLTPEQVEDMRKQGCGICGGFGREGRWGNLHIDHCHITGKVRGVLCHKCNVGLGHFRNDPELLEAAAKYLRSP